MRAHARGDLMGKAPARLASQVAALLVLAACAPSSSSSQSPRATAQPSNVFERIDWTAPFSGSGVVVSSVAEAERFLGFTVHVPGALGTESVIYVSPEAPLQDMAMAFVYQLADFGQVWITEYLPYQPDESLRAADYDEVVKGNGGANVQGTAEIATVRADELALMTYSEQGGYIEWVEDGVQITISGPTLTRDDLLELVDRV